METDFNFKLQTNMYHGIGVSRTLGDFLVEKGYKEIAVLVDEGVYKGSKYFNEIYEIIKQKMPSVNLQVLRGTEEPDYDYLDEIAAHIREIDTIDVIIGIGGGSCLDIAKAVAVLKTNPGKGIEYRGFDKIKTRGVPVIAIPTTAGTGSEVTINAVFTDKKEQKKLGINGRFVNAAYAILDAEWTMSCPSSVAVSSGMDALTHTLESFMCTKANPLTRTFSKEAFRLLYSSLPCLVDDPENKEKRQNLLLGSYFAGIALFNSGSGIAGAFSYPLGVHYKIPHGIGGGIFLASVVEYNVSKGYLDFAELYDLIENNDSMSHTEKSKGFLKAIKDLSKYLKVPDTLTQWKITENNIEEVAVLLHPLQVAFDQNPVPFSSEKDALMLLKRHVAP